VALSVWLLLFTVLGITPRTILLRTWPLLIAAPLSGLSMLLYAQPGGRIHLQWWLVTVSDNSIELAAAITVRVLAIGVPALVALVGIDPTRLADALGQIARLPARFVVGALAAVRLAGVLAADHRSLSQARRARGLGDSRSLRGLASLPFALVVTAIRRGTMLATAMEARAFGTGERTWARPSRLRPRDAVAIAVALGVSLAAVGLALALGTFRLVGAGG
jgi:energy-coupling factor transport system permease protein